MKRIILLFFLYCNICFSQSIKGTLKDEAGNTISYTSMFIKENSDPSTVLEFYTLRNGIIDINLKNNYKDILLEINAVGYDTESYIIQNSKKTEIYTLDFVLKKTTQLDEIVVVSEKKKFVVKKDTISYNIDKYKDSSDRKVQDVLKRLPGIEVNEKSGEIKYKGKSVETVTLDGDNLFGYNYSIGTKNININMIDQVEAIDNYSENPLLKNIEEGGKVSLNLKLKKGKTDFSGNLDFGLGVNNESKILNNSNSNLLGVSNKLKTFSVLSYNNVGINQSPFDYFSSNKNIEQTKENQFQTQKILHESVFSNIIEDDKVNNNNLLFTNFNSIFKVSKSANIKTNLFYLKDKIDFTQKNTSENYINNSTLITSDNYNTLKKPEFVKGDFETKINTSKTTLIEYCIKFNYEKIVTNSTILSNNNNYFESNLISENINFLQSLKFTKKIDAKRAFQIKVNQSFNNIPQNLQLNNLEQTSNFKKNYIDAVFAFIGTKNNFKYTISTGFQNEKTPFYSKNIESINDFNYIRNNIFCFGSIVYAKNKWSFSPSLSLKYLRQYLDESNNELSKNSYLFEPSLLIKYKIKNNSFITSNLNFNQNPFSEEYLYANPIFLNNRMVINNIVNFNIQKTQSFNIYFYNNNLFKQFFFSSGINYKKNNGAFFSNFSITENKTILSKLFLNENNENINANVSLSKFINFLNSNVKYNSNISKSNYKNLVNSTDLRNNTSYGFENSIIVNSAFNTKINFENTFTHQFNINQSENFEKITNTSIIDNFKIKYKTSKLFYTAISNDLYIPNIANSNNYLFIDLTITYKSKNKKYEVTFVGKNILNNKMFTQIQTTDYSINKLENSLLQRYFFVNVNYNL